MAAEPSEENSSDETSSDNFSLSGFAGTADYYGMTKNYRNEDNKTFRVEKAEAYLKVNGSYEFNEIYSIRSVIFGHACSSISPELRDYYKDKNFMNLQEFYFSAMFDNVDFQAGNQLIKWGTANTINPTSYFNPFDLTEILLKETDELYIGVPALTVNIMMNDYFLKFVYLPVHTPTRLPERAGPWALRMPEKDIAGFTIPVETADIAFKPYFNYDRHSADDYSIGTKLGASLNGLDISLSGYYGYDRDIVLLPVVKTPPLYPLEWKIELSPYYSRITAIGFDFAFPVSDVTLYGEGTYTFNKSAVTDAAALYETETRIERTGYAYGVLGFNWFYDENFKIIVEYLKGAYVETKALEFNRKDKRYIDPFFSDLLSGSIEKTVYDGSLTLGVKAMYNTLKHDAMIIPKAGLKLYDNFLIEAGVTLFSGKKDTLFGSYRERDVINFKAGYYF